MKKTFFTVLVIVLLSTMAFAEGIVLGDFLLGKWLDSTWDAVWEFRSGNIRILDTEGGVYYDFDGKTVTDFSIKPSSKGLVLSFGCEETGKEYEFTKPLTNMNLMMVIDMETGNHYEKELPFQR